MNLSEQKRPIKILHVVGGMDPGGVETWLMHVLRRIDRSRYQFDFLTHKTKKCFYDDEIRSLGSRILPCMHPSRPWQYAGNFFRILKKNGPYDVVHSHVHHFSGFTLMLAHLGGVPIRIAHSHSDTSLNDGGAGLWRKFYLRIAEWGIYCHATRGLACSSIAATSLFGKNWEKDSRWQIFYCGVDLRPFVCTIDRAVTRQEFGIPSEALVLGHVGRFVKTKNHIFLLDIFAEILRREPNAYLLLVGDGPLREDIEIKIQSLGLMSKVIFAGIRSDVPRLMLGIMDVFVFPSFYEGLPMVLVEAQAAGLPSVISDAISGETVLVPKLITALSLERDLSIWAQVVLDNVNARKFCSESQKVISSSKFNAKHSTIALCNVYVGGRNT